MWKCNILIGVSGSISAYKMADVVSKLVQMGHKVRVAASESSLEFVGASTWEGLTGEPPLLSSFERGRQMSHIHWGREADLILFAPATAHTLNSMAAGLGGSPLLELYLAHDFKKPLLVAPAMNTMMWQHPATTQSVRSLERHGVIFVGPDAGSLACGEVGDGRLIQPDKLLDTVLKHLPKPAAAKKFLITYGGTDEHIDDVRTLSNTSTGRSGAQLAETLIQRGHHVEVLRSLNAPAALGAAREWTFTDAASLAELLRERLRSHVDTWVQMAAVSDFALEEVFPPADSSRKISSQRERLTLKLKRAPKLIQAVKRGAGCTLVAFKLTSHASSVEAQDAVSRLSLAAPVDFVVHNDLKDHQKGEPVYTLYSGRGEALGRHAGVAPLAAVIEGLEAKTTPPPENFHDLMP